MLTGHVEKAKQYKNIGLWEINERCPGCSLLLDAAWALTELWQKEQIKGKKCICDMCLNKGGNEDERVKGSH